jgi:hypothetical protein
MGVHVSVSQELVKDWLDKMADRLEKQMDEMGGLLDSGPKTPGQAFCAFVQLEYCEGRTAQ